MTWFAIVATICSPQGIQCFPYAGFLVNDYLWNALMSQPPKGRKIKINVSLLPKMRPCWVFTDSALWAGSVIELSCLIVFVYVCPKVVIVKNSQSIIFFFLHKIEGLYYVPRIPNLELHKNCMNSSKVTTILTTFFCWWFEKLWKIAQNCRQVSERRDFIVLVLISAHAETFGVSRMRDFYRGQEKTYLQLK